MPIYPNFYQTLSACPIVELRGYAAACGLKGRLYAYLDFAGPTGTARDGLAEGMLALAIEKKKLISGQPIIEAASGPFAAALTLAGLTAGHPVVLVMPEDAPALRQETLLRLGAQIRHSPARSGVNGARRLAAQTAAANGWYYMDWLANDDNPEYHRRVTGPAIVQSIAREGKSAVDAIVIGVGSGGTVTGVGETIKAWTNDVRIAAVEPYESQALGGGLTGPHGISDLGYGFVPENFNAYVVDNVVAVNTTDAQRAAQKVLRTDAIPASVASGGVLQPGIALGASGGAILGILWMQVFHTNSIGMYALLGACALLAASQQAPLMAICLVMELADAPINLFVPIGFAVAVSAFTASCLGEPLAALRLSKSAEKKVIKANAR